MRPPALDHPPRIDPREHAVESRYWGEDFEGHLVSYQARWYVWLTCPEGPDEGLAYEVTGEDDGREHLACELAQRLAFTDWGECVASAGVVDQGSGRDLFLARVLDGAEDGIWLTACETDGTEDRWTLTRFDEVSEAVESFAARTDQSADSVAQLDTGWPGIAAGYLSYRAASARAGAARATLGDTIRGARGRIRAERAVSRVAAMSGVSREFLYRILAGDEWTWKGLMSARQNALPPPPRPALNRNRAGRKVGWSVCLRFGIEAPGEAEAQSIAAAALSKLALGKARIGLASAPWAAPARRAGFWVVTIDLDVSGLGSIEPDDARTYAAYVGGQFDVQWNSRGREPEAAWTWPPDFWDRRPGIDDQLLHPAIHAAMIQVAPSGGDG